VGTAPDLATGTDRLYGRFRRFGFARESLRSGPGTWGRSRDAYAVHCRVPPVKPCRIRTLDIQLERGSAESDRNTGGTSVLVPGLAQPQPFLEILVHDLGVIPGLTGASAGFELGEWRAQQLAEHLMEWIPEFTLTYSELDQLDHANAVWLMRRAASIVYDTDTYARRGEFGELILHVLLRQAIGTLPAISKIYFKDAANDTVKGFDAVHVVPTGDELQLWLGEAKFYKDLSSAINDSVASINDHFSSDYLRSEFQAIVNKLDPSWPYADRLAKLLDRNTSLDTIFDSLCIPVLLTYDSNVVNSHTESTEAYKEEFEAEVRSAHQNFSAKGLPTKVQIHLFLTPLGSKDELVSELDRRLKAWQTA